MGAHETITLESKGNFVSNETAAERLEVFMENLSLKDENEALKAQLKQKDLAHVEELSTLRHQQGDPVQTAIQMLQGYAHLKTQLEEATAYAITLKAEGEEREAIIEERAELIKTQYAAATKITEQRDHYKAECDRVLKKHNAEVDKANGVITKLEAQVASLRKQLNELNALNPKRMQKKLKELQAKNKELTEGNQRLQEQRNTLKGADKALLKIKDEYDQLVIDYNRTRAALDEAVTDLNNGNKPKCLEASDGWEIYGSTESDDVLMLVDTVSGIERPYCRDTGFTNVRKPPAAVMKLLDKTLHRITLIREHTGMKEVNE